MTSDLLLLVGRDAGDARTVLQTHADRLVQREVAADARVLTYEHDPVAELGDELAAIDHDRVYAVPSCVAHSRDTLRALPNALAGVDAEVTYCEPLGGSPALTELLVRRGLDHATRPESASLALVGFGSGATPDARRTVEHHAAAVRESGPFGEVVTCYLLQNPTVECLRYNVDGDEVVAVPVFLADCESTRESIPEKLELDRGGVAYADVLGEDPLVTDAIEAELAKQRVLTTGDAPSTFEDSLLGASRPVATDGRGDRV